MGQWEVGFSLTLWKTQEGGLAVQTYQGLEHLSGGMLGPCQSLGAMASLFSLFPWDDRYHAVLLS